jgi:Uncharacterized alpha/beta hydrolase domain (DUF2235)
MGRKLVVCLDGTNNRFSHRPINVIRLLRSLTADQSKVLSYYDQGVGTFGLKETLFEWQKFPARVFGLAFGWGLARIVCGAYEFLAKNYAADEDHIYIFGFSRGAYAARALAALIRAAKDFAASHGPTEIIHCDCFFVGKVASSLSPRAGTVISALLRKRDVADDEDEQNCEGYLLQHKRLRWYLTPGTVDERSPFQLFQSPSTDPRIARDPPDSVGDSSHTVRKFDIDDVRSRYMLNCGFGAGQDGPFVPARSRYRRADPSRTGSLPIAATIPALGRLIQERTLFSYPTNRHRVA